MKFIKGAPKVEVDFRSTNLFCRPLTPPPVVWLKFATKPLLALKSTQYQTESSSRHP